LFDGKKLFRLPVRREIACPSGRPLDGKFARPLVETVTRELPVDTILFIV
jgi:hypothetical protein